MQSHPYYVSVVELKNNSAEKIVEVTCRLFTDDLEIALKDEGSGPIDLMHPSDKSDTDKKLFAYLKRHLAVSINNQKQGFEYVGYEISEEAVNMYVQIAFDGKFQTIHLSSDLLYRQHTEQTCIFHFIDGEKKESRRLINPQKDLDIKF